MSAKPRRLGSPRRRLISARSGFGLGPDQFKPKPHLYLESYEPYGASTHTGTSVNGQLFAGQTYDFNNLYYMRHRYYLPAIGRFISRDPIGLAGGLNLYAYANDDPVDLSDPTGLCSNATYDGGSEAGEVAGAASLLLEDGVTLLVMLSKAMPRILTQEVWP